MVDLVLTSLVLAGFVLLLGMAVLKWVGHEKPMRQTWGRTIVAWMVAGILICGLIQVYVNWSYRPFPPVLGLELYGFLFGGVFGAAYASGAYRDRRGGRTTLELPKGYDERFSGRPLSPAASELPTANQRRDAISLPEDEP